MGQFGYQVLGLGGYATRGIAIGGGPNAGPSTLGTMDYVEIATLGNAAEFGDLTVQSVWNTRGGNCGNAVRGLIAGGGDSLPTNIIQYVTISTLGNAVDFGDRTVAKNQIAHMSSTTRGVFAGAGEKDTNVVDYVNIMTTGNAIDFGNLLASRRQLSGSSNGHGGL